MAACFAHENEKNPSKPSTVYENTREGVRVSYTHRGENGKSTGKRTVVHWV